MKSVRLSFIYQKDQKNQKDSRTSIEAGMRVWVGGAVGSVIRSRIMRSASLS